MKEITNVEMTDVKGGEFTWDDLCLIAGTIGVVLVNPLLYTIGLACSGIALGIKMKEWE